MYKYVYVYICIYIYIYIYVYTQIYTYPLIGRGDDTVGNPHRAHFSPFELFELFLFLELDKQLSIEQFEPTVSQSTVSPPS